ncbi:MAG: M48 family metalloprotease [Mariprofundaceae bacterium]|nr:M48 family metalloprotease [Mariprofundaceae bacterium]
MFTHKYLKSKTTMYQWLMLLSLVATPLFYGCAINPVTGQKELILISESAELAMGEKNYLPARQMQGGDYIADPAVIAYVQEVGQKLAAVSDRRLPYEFTVLNNSEINAWAMPGGKLAINRGLLMKMDSEAELASVLGHEIVHAAAKHSAKQIQKGMLIQGAVLAANMAIQTQSNNQLTQNIGMLGTNLAASMLNARFSRNDEYESDHYGMVYMSRAGYDPFGAVRMQELLLSQKKGRDNLFSNLLSSHPPSADRVAANRLFAAQLPAGKTGRNEYHRRLQSLFDAAPAYDAYEKGVKAFAAKKYSRARSLAEQAIRIESRESQFHLLRGSALEQGNNKNAALREYKKAASMNPGYFQTHLKLGLLYDTMGHKQQAKQSLESSVALLKTAPAMQKLGQYALHDGNMNLARSYLSAAASSNTPVGKSAYSELLRFDLPANPSQYLKTRFGLNEQGQMLVAIKNNTPFPVSALVIEVRSATRYRSIKLRGEIQANAQSTFNIGKLITAEQLRATRVRMVGATLAK